MGSLKKPERKVFKKELAKKKEIIKKGFTGKEVKNKDVAKRMLKDLKEPLRISTKREAKGEPKAGRKMKSKLSGLFG